MRNQISKNVVFTLIIIIVTLFILLTFDNALGKDAIRSILTITCFFL